MTRTRTAFPQFPQSPEREWTRHRSSTGIACVCVCVCVRVRACVLAGGEDRERERERTQSGGVGKATARGPREASSY